MIIFYGLKAVLLQFFAFFPCAEKYGGTGDIEGAGIEHGIGIDIIRRCSGVVVNPEEAADIHVRTIVIDGGIIGECDSTGSRGEDTGGIDATEEAADIIAITIDDTGTRDSTCAREACGATEGTDQAADIISAIDGGIAGEVIVSCERATGEGAEEATGIVTGSGDGTGIIVNTGEDTAGDQACDTADGACATDSETVT